MRLFAYIFALFNLISLINTITVTPENFQEELSKAIPGTIIELSTGIYNKIPYKLSQSGIFENPIIIKPYLGANIQFEGTTEESCIFELNSTSYLHIIGNMELFGAHCGIKALDCDSILIKGLEIHDIKHQAIISSGDNIEISDNIIYKTCLDSKDKASTLIFGESQCINVLGKKNNQYSTNVVLKNNSIYNSYGEGIKLQNCDFCSVMGNNIKNTFAINIYIYTSRNIIMDGNDIKITSKEYNSKFGKAVGIGLSSDIHDSINNITIQNNIIIGCRIGIYYFPNGIGSYELIKIYHNTIWMIDISPIWFTDSLSKTQNNELYNNFLYHQLQSQFSPKAVWKIGYNIFYNSGTLPPQFKDTQGVTSKFIKEVDLSTIFNNQNGDCDYINLDNININCFRPSSSPDSIKLFNGGIQKSVGKDLEGCNRENQPSIGAFEFPDGCEVEPDTSDTTDSIETDEPETDIPVTDEPEKHYDVIFKMQYYDASAVKIMGSFCKWKIDTCPSMTKNSNGYWTYTYLEATSLTFQYKFGLFNGNEIYHWECDPNRAFEGNKFEENIKSGKYTGTINDCDYKFENEIITLTCNWREK